MTDPTAISHQADSYDCPFCGLLAGRFDERNDPGDIVARESLAYARVSPMCWVDHPAMPVTSCTCITITRRLGLEERRPYARWLRSWLTPDPLAR